MIILGIETSCDETAVAIVSTDKTIHAHALITQDKHTELGGVVPEVAARAHLDAITPMVNQALYQANMKLTDIDAIAATAGPGLIGGVIVGTMVAKGLATSLNIPYLAVNHLAGHALIARLTDDLTFPYLMLLTSGGHCQFLIAKSPTDFIELGSTLDDAAGEAFDKVGRMLGFSYPAGPTIEAIATKGDPKTYNFPRPLLRHENHQLDFSFSGLKTSAKRAIDAHKQLDDTIKSNIAASFQQAVSDVFCEKTKRAIDACHSLDITPTAFVLTGGVAANKKLRHDLEQICIQKNTKMIAPPIKLCTDNGVMIAWAGAEMISTGQTSPLDFAPRPRWPLSTLNNNSKDES